MTTSHTSTLVTTSQPATSKTRREFKRRKEPTEEQKAAAKERREQIKKLCHVVKALTPEKRVLLASRFGIRNPEGRELSTFNQCLLIHQSEKVSIVGGFQQWRKLGRTVKKGARALAIWVPIGSKSETDSAEPEGDEDTRFILGNVFDISQTETPEERAHREACEAVNAHLPGHAPVFALPEHAADVIEADAELVTAEPAADEPTEPSFEVLPPEQPATPPAASQAAGYTCPEFQAEFTLCDD